MRKLGESLRDVAFGLAIVYLLALAVLAFKLVLAHPLPQVVQLGWLSNRAGLVAVYLAGAVAVLLAAYFALRLGDQLSRRRRFARGGEGGPIEVSPLAVQDFIRTLLAQERPDLQAHVRLQRTPQGALSVTLTAGLPADATLVETAEHLQRLLKERIEAQLGVPVEQVAFYARRVGLPAGSAPPTSQPGAVAGGPEDGQQDEGEL